METKILIARPEDQPIVENLARFYVYDMYRHCGFIEDAFWKVPENGLFECVDLSSYWNEPGRHPFIIRVDEELAGFALVNKVGSSSDVDWNMGEFFVVSKFQGRGVGRRAAKMIFDRFPGVWEVRQIPQNQPAVDFWEKVVSEYTNGDYERSQKAYKPMQQRIFLKFRAPTEKSDSQLHILYREDISMADESKLLTGIIQNATAVKQMTAMRPFAFLLRHTSGGVLGGAKGTTLYGCLYIDLLWIHPDMRRQGWGSQLIHKSECLGKSRACSFATLSTMDWEALSLYQKLGYQIEFTREGYERDSKMYYLRKNL